MKYRIVKTTRYRKELRKMLKRGKDIKKISAVVRMLAMGETLPPQYHDHALSGDLAGLRDCLDARAGGGYVGAYHRSTRADVRFPRGQDRTDLLSHS